MESGKDADLMFKTTPDCWCPLTFVQSVSVWGNPFPVSYIICFKLLGSVSHSSWFFLQNLFLTAWLSHSMGEENIQGAWSRFLVWYWLLPQQVILVRTPKGKSPRNKNLNHRSEICEPADIVFFVFHCSKPINRTLRFWSRRQQTLILKMKRKKIFNLVDSLCSLRICMRYLTYWSFLLIFYWISEVGNPTLKTIMRIKWAIEHAVPITVDVAHS